MLLVSENKQIMLNDDFNEIGICNIAINIKRIAIKDCLLFNELLFFEVNLFMKVLFLNLMLNLDSLLILVV